MTFWDRISTGIFYFVLPWSLAAGGAALVWSWYKPDAPGAFTIIAAFFGCLCPALARELNWYLHRNDPRIEIDRKRGLITMHLTPEWAEKLGLPPR